MNARELPVARARFGPPMPNNSPSWEIVVHEGQDARTLALRCSKDEAEAFADGYNLGVRARLDAIRAAGGET